MNNILLKNDNISMEISDLGAEILSLKKGSKEYIRNGKSDVWNGHAPVLFPICGRLAEDKFIAGDNVFSLGMHGFAKMSIFEIENATDTEAVFLLKENSDTLKHYPFCFELRIIYKLKNDSIHIKYSVKNTDIKTIYFSIGAHETYACNGGIENYSLIFETCERFETLLLNGSYLNHKTLKISDDSAELPLKYSYFKLDTLIFKDPKSKRVELKNNITGDTVGIDFSSFKNLLLWTLPVAEFICIEPWNGLPDYVDSDCNIMHKPDIITLPKGEFFDCVHTISFKK